MNVPIPLLSKAAGALLKPALRRLSRNRLPQIEGRLYLPALRSPVLVTRDRWGIATIQASDRHDLFMAQGFVHAQDRLWQMEIHRRAANGTLSALLGQPGLQTDRLSRTLGFSRLARATWESTSKRVRSDLQAYAAGINAYLQNRRPLPLEFALLRHEPEIWQPLDSIALGRMISWTLSHGFANKLTRARLIERIGPEAAAELELFYPPDNPVTLPAGIEFNLLEPDGMLRASEGPFIRRNMESVGRGSNAWVVSGRRSATGHPILCNDMHLPITTPSLWHVLHLECQPAAGKEHLNVAGASLPGLPYVLVGHNNHIAWGATVSFVDSEDLFIERFSPDGAALYEFNGQWRPAEVIDETIAIRGRSAHVEQVIITHHGPLISEIFPSSKQAMALASKALEPDKNFEGFALLNEAKEWDDFAAAVQKIGSPSINLMFADKAGNIGYYVTGRAPIRRSGAGQVPMPGWSGEHEWIAEVPFAEMPHALNPGAGFLVNANNRIVADDYPHFLGNAWRNGYRARRIEDFITEHDLLTIGDMRRLQSDFVSIPGQELCRFLRHHFGPEGCVDAEAQACLTILKQWNGRMMPASIGALAYKTLVAELSTAILAPRLGQTLTEQYLGAGPHPFLYPFGESHGQWMPVLLRLLQSDRSSWIEDKSQLLEKSLARTMILLRAKIDDDTASWSWGAKHKIRFGHTLSAQKPLNEVFDVGPFVVGGDADTVCQMSISQDDYANNIAPSFRLLIDTGDWDAALAMHAPGQSGHLASPHYANLSEPWLQGAYYSLNWSSPAVEAGAHNSLQLLPWPESVAVDMAKSSQQAGTPASD